MMLQRNIFIFVWCIYNLKLKQNEKWGFDFQNFEPNFPFIKSDQIYIYIYIEDDKWATYCSCKEKNLNRQCSIKKKNPA